MVLHSLQLYCISWSVWFLCCLSTLSLSEDIQCHGWSNSYHLLCLHTKRTLSRKVKWAVSLVVADGQFNLRSLCGYVWVNILTSLPPSWGRKGLIAHTNILNEWFSLKHTVKLVPFPWKHPRTNISVKYCTPYVLMLHNNHSIFDWVLLNDSNNLYVLNFRGT